MPTNIKLQSVVAKPSRYLLSRRKGELDTHELIIIPQNIIPTSPPSIWLGREVWRVL